MARPKKDGSPTAAARIEVAFFDVLAVTPFDKITVSAIVEAAGVNRNSFYYHFAGLDELSRSAVANLLIPEIPKLLASGFSPESEQIDELFLRAATDTGNLHRIPVIMGQHSTSRLRNMLKDSMLALWLDAFGIAPDELDVQASVTVHFALGGMLEILSRLDPHADLLTELAAVRRLPIVQATVPILMATLAEASEHATADSPQNEAQT
ncbi:MAG: TetR/AcrR family transcriptional regulator [Gulosibacter sp.]|uniref:TetR/AcrR family transcriptional regulator n=1 Tax=Gulosibacter sp. TaxID=2817531 RepID=UPI003F931E66